MRILVLGAGGREHALIWNLKNSPIRPTLFCLPGNAGMQTVAECPQVEVDSSTRFKELLDWVEAHAIELTIVGPEAPLAAGIVDSFQERFGVGPKAPHKIFGPSFRAAQLEASKVFAKECLREWNIPTARGRECTSQEEVRAAGDEFGFPERPLVLKADGLAAGKGVWICADAGTLDEALAAFFERGLYGEAGRKILVEEFLEGEEVSFLALCDGHTAVPLASSQDHKRIFDDDRGPNTGGMGAYSPAPRFSPALEQKIMELVINPAIAGMRQKGAPYTGILYAGLMMTSSGPKVLEFNCRFGDPEAQVILMRLKSDLVELLQAAVDGKLESFLKTSPLQWDPRPAVCVVMASKGYPERAVTGDVIYGLEELKTGAELQVFHAGTTRQGGKIVTSGGRVLGVTALGESLSRAIGEVYGAVQKITWSGAQFRRDIGKKGLRN